MIHIPLSIWDYDAAYDAADALEVDIDIRPVYQAMSVGVADQSKARRWVNAYVDICIQKIKGESSSELVVAGMEAQ